MIALVIGVPCLVGLFGYLSHTNPLDPTWIDSTVRTSLTFFGVLVLTVLVFLESKYIDGKILKALGKFMNGGVEDD